MEHGQAVALAGVLVATRAVGVVGESEVVEEPIHAELLRAMHVACPGLRLTESQLAPGLQHELDGSHARQSPIVSARRQLGEFLIEWGAALMAADKAEANRYPSPAEQLQFVRNLLNSHEEWRETGLSSFYGHFVPIKDVLQSINHAWDIPQPYEENPLELVAKLIDERDMVRDIGTTLSKSVDWLRCERDRARAALQQMLDTFVSHGDREHTVAILAREALLDLPQPAPAATEADPRKDMTEASMPGATANEFLS
jgi:hypothetical protein